MPNCPLRSIVPPVLATAAVMALISSATSLLAGVMTPSPLKRVLAKMAAISAVSANEMRVSSLPKFANICLAALANFCPSSFSALISSMSIASFPGKSRSGFFNTLVAHWDTPTTSFTRIFPSASKSTYLRLFSSISSPLTGQESTVHILVSSSSRCAMSCPVAIFTLEHPPMFSNCHLYFWSFFNIAIAI